MRTDLTECLRCPSCRSPNMQLHGSRGQGGTTADGTLRCAACSKEFAIEGGIVKFPLRHAETIREVKQWEVFAAAEGWLEADHAYLETLPGAGANILKPHDTIGWLNHECNFFRVIEPLDLAGKYVLDMGAGRCWSSKWMALKGAKVVALDAMAHATVGLGAADLYMKNHSIYFDRVVGEFDDLPFQDETFDIVFASGALHHTLDFAATIAEIARTLKPSGVFAVANEPVSRDFRSIERSVTVGAAEGIVENQYKIKRWLDQLKINGLVIDEVIESMVAYDRKSLYYQGSLGAVFNSWLGGRIALLRLRGGVLNSVAHKSRP